MFAAARVAARTAERSLDDHRAASLVTTTTTTGSSAAANDGLPDGPSVIPTFTNDDNVAAADAAAAVDDKIPTSGDNHDQGANNSRIENADATATNSAFSGKLRSSRIFR